MVNIYSGKLWSTYVVPRFPYGLEVLDLKIGDIKSLEQFQRKYSLFKTEFKNSIALARARIQKIVSEGSNFDNFFFSLMRGGRIRIPLLAGHQRPARETPFKWRFAGGPMMAQH